MRHLNIIIHGQVQGVFFRDSARKKAQELGLGGFAMNKSDGTVYIEAEGSEEKLEKFLAWCHEGSEMAAVKKVESKENNLKDFTEFVIRR